MIRTQVYLTKPQFQGLKILSQKENKPVAKIIRTLLDQGLKKEMKTNNAKALLQLAKEAVPSGIKDFSANIDKYLYE